MLPADEPALAVLHLTLTDFRCYRSLRLETDGRSVVLTGPNGAGKTNLLEALSYLAPGRGLRRAKLSEVGRVQPANGAGGGAVHSRPWAVAARLRLDGDEIEIGTGLDPAAADADGQAGQSRDPGLGRSAGRVIKIDGEVVKSQAELGRTVSAIWLTPQMDRLFIDGAGGRRRFIDRLLYGLDPDHAGPLAAFEQSLRGRNRVLRDSRNSRGDADSDWLAALEDSMARHGIAVAARRLDAVQRLAEFCTGGDGPFPGAELAMTGAIETWLREGPALDAEDRFREHLAASRAADTEAGGAQTGPHRSEFEVRQVPGGMPARQCSTGEQKALLVAIILAAARLQAAVRGRAPLVLLDEVVAHLDAEMRRALFATITGLGAQAWLTGTDEQVFAEFSAVAQHFRVADGAVAPA